ncbi:transmembrane protein 267-like [Haliotis rubra]|uniref:transmembrane protein 267-like n=1 Tax=Haliotis rubra TaxID=36100 RepID=UPI001EE591DE|nr:transmembrane protein 267-like [Haliotis rubra]
MHPIPDEKSGNMTPDEVTKRVYAMLLSPLNLIFDDNISKTNTLVLIVVLFSTCLIGDNSLSYIYSTHLWARAGIDSATHGLIALWSWALVENVNFDRYKLLNCLLCAVLAVSVDLDHFYAAGSFDIKTAVSLPDRPPLHLTTMIPVVSTILWILGMVLKVRYLKKLSLIFLTAVLSHHFRDATREGLWLAPFSNTHVEYWTYVAVTMVIPVLVRKVFVRFLSEKKVLYSSVETAAMIPTIFTAKY